jgi:DNA-binding NtrC family response regulator
VDLLLVDMVMPEMTGAEVARAVLDRFARLPVIYMTGYVDPGHLDVPKEQSLLKKPFTVNELAAKVEEALQAREAYAAFREYPVMKTTRNAGRRCFGMRFRIGEDCGAARGLFDRFQPRMLPFGLPQTRRAPSWAG